MTTALARGDQAWTDEEIADFLRRRLGDHLLEVTHEFATFTVHVDAEGYVHAARLLSEEPRLGFVMFDCLFGIDAREDGFDLVAILYAPEFGKRVCLRHRCEGGRQAPVAPTLTHLYEGANWHERETWDMFGIEFEGHPGLEPRILTVENFEGWPLRKDFYLASREAKPWPGVKEPAELDDEGNVIVRVPGPGDASGPMELDEAMAEQAKRANPELEAETRVVEPEGPGAGGPGDDQPAAEESGGDDLDEALRTGDDADEDAEVATDSGRVVAGGGERDAEVAEGQAAQERAEREQARKEAAEERARRAAERAGEGDDEAAAGVTTPGGDTAQVPGDRDRAARSPGEGGAPGTPTGPVADRDEQDSADVEGGIDETVEDARRGDPGFDDDQAEPPVAPEGRSVEEPDEPADADDLEPAEDETDVDRSEGSRSDQGSRDDTGVDRSEGSRSDQGSRDDTDDEEESGS